MWAIVAKGIWEKRIRLIIIILLCLTFVWMYASFYPSIADKADEFDQLLDSYPEGFMEAFGMEGNSMFSSFAAFLSIEYLSIVWPIILVVLIVTYASWAIAGEIEQGTIEVLLAQPISRTKLYWAKYLSGLIIILIFITLSILPASTIAGFYDVEIDTSKLLMFSALGLLFGWAIYSINFFLSSIFSTRGNPTFITAGVVIVMYVLNILASLKESAENLKYTSYFHYYDFNKAIIDGQIDSLTLWVFIGSIVVFSFAGWLYFNKRDIPV